MATAKTRNKSLPGSAAETSPIATSLFLLRWHAVTNPYQGSESPELRYVVAVSSKDAIAYLAELTGLKKRAFNVDAEYPISAGKVVVNGKLRQLYEFGHTVTPASIEGREWFTCTLIRSPQNFVGVVASSAQVACDYVNGLGHETRLSAVESWGVIHNGEVCFKGHGEDRDIAFPLDKLMVEIAD